MTREELTKWAESHGWDRDKQGNYQKLVSTNLQARKYRIKLQKLSFRYEVWNEEIREWIRIRGGYYRDCYISENGKLAKVQGAKL